MKTNVFIIILIAIFASSYVQAQGKIVKANIKVYGNCIMCKKRIETALDRNGIKQANWNIDTKILEVVYNSKKITEKEIHELVAGAGHDTEKVKAKNEVYAELPFCCLYRNHDHSGIQDDDHHDHGNH